MTRLAIDPVTRVVGHLRVEADVVGGVVNDAWCSGTMFRGIEAVLPGRDARDAWQLAQRVCGTCTGVHALASVRAVENALGISVPANALLVRNLIAGSVLVQDDVMGFYLRWVPDWADAASALTADPSATSALARSMSDWPNSTAAYFRSAQDRLATLVDSGPLTSGYWGHPAYVLPPELNLVVFSHYLEALDWQRKLVRARTILGGKSPHPQTYLVGGMAVAPEWGGPTRPGQGEHPWRAARHSPAPLSDDGQSDIAQLIAESAPFVNDVFVPDVMALAERYPDWQAIGAGHGHLMSFGEFPNAGHPDVLSVPRGRVMDRDLSRVEIVDQGGVSESISHSWYEHGGGDEVAPHPSAGQTTPRYRGPRPPYQSLEGYDEYSWLKAPRYTDEPMEVGALARVLVAYAGGASDVRTVVDPMSARLAHGADGLFSVVGRAVARAAEAQLVVGRLGGWVNELGRNLASNDLALVDLSMWDPSRWPSEATGFGLAEGPRGAVGHWLRIRDRRIADYQVVDGSTWNASPRDARGRRGACEQALVGTPVADAARPLEILRTIHSFDPCLACAVH